MDVEVVDRVMDQLERRVSIVARFAGAFLERTVAGSSERSILTAVRDCGLWLRNEVVVFLVDSFKLLVLMVFGLGESDDLYSAGAAQMSTGPGPRYLRVE